MTYLTETEIDQVEYLLGYINFPQLVEARLSESYKDIKIERLNELFLELKDIDEQIQNARRLSFVEGVRNSKVNYRAQLIILRQDGSRLLQELATLLGVALLHDKYRPPNSTKSTYW